MAEELGGKRFRDLLPQTVKRFLKDQKSHEHSTSPEFAIASGFTKWYETALPSLTQQVQATGSNETFSRNILRKAFGIGHIESLLEVDLTGNDSTEGVVKVEREFEGWKGTMEYEIVGENGEGKPLIGGFRSTLRSEETTVGKSARSIVIDYSRPVSLEERERFSIEITEPATRITANLNLTNLGGLSQVIIFDNSPDKPRDGRDFINTAFRASGERIS